MENLEKMFETGLYINDLSMHDSSRDLVLAGTQQQAELKMALDQVGVVMFSVLIIKKYTCEVLKNLFVNKDFLLSLFTKKISVIIKLLVFLAHVLKLRNKERVKS